MNERPNLHLFHGTATFTGRKQIRVGDQVLESERIFLDTGARPVVPPISGLSAVNYLTNENIMDLTVLPDHLIVLGAGYIGLEFAQMFRRFGSKVTVIQTRSQIVPREDPEIAAELQRALAAEGIRFMFNARTAHVEEKG